MRLKSDVRHELKYLIDWQQREAILADLQAYMLPDNHGDSVGQYTITSLYYDSAGYGAYWEKIEGEKLRRKIRVRTYGESVVLPQTSCFLEIKERRNKTLSKRRARLPYQDAERLSDLGDVAERYAEDEDNEDFKSVLDEVYYLYRVRQLEPACVVRYNRLALNGGADHPDLRVTFDSELRGRTHDLTLLSTSHAHDVYFLPPELCVMEIKVNQSVPYWLSKLVNKHHCTMRRISKYCRALEKNLDLTSRQTIAT